MYVAAATAAAAAGSVGEMKVRRNVRADKPKRSGSESGRHSGVTTWSLTTFRHVIGLDWLEPFRRRIYKWGAISSVRTFTFYISFLYHFRLFNDALPRFLWSTTTTAITITTNSSNNSSSAP